MSSDPDLDLDLDADGLLAAAAEAERAVRLAEVRRLEVLSAWAAAHSGDPTQGPDGRLARRVGNVLRRLGGDGTPGVQDFCLGEIALARGAGVTATSNALADVLDLQHRLPLTWSVCRRGECEVWVARRVAKLSRHLARDKVGVVDSAVSRMIATEAPGRILKVAEAKVIEADTALHEQRREAERRRRYVGLGRTDDLGLRTLIARLEAGDAAAVDATVHRVAEIIAPRHPEAFPEELRALAFGWLARPAELFTLLLEHTTPDPELDLDLDLDLDRDPADAEPPVLARALALPADLLDALRKIDVTTLVPRGVLHVHLHEAALHAGDGVARVEGLGPVTLTRLTELLRHVHLKVQPVKDLSARVRYTAYEHPESLRDQVHLVTGGDYWPYATSTSRTVDLDHPTPYQHGDDGRDPPARADRLPQQWSAGPATPPLEDPRRLPLPPVRRGPLRLAHPPTAWGSSSTTPAPTASTPRRPASSSTPHPASTSTRTRRPANSARASRSLVMLRGPAAEEGATSRGRACTQPRRVGLVGLHRLALDPAGQLRPSRRGPTRRVVDRGDAEHPCAA